MTIDQSLPLTFEETLKYYLVPPRWYIRYRVWKEFKKGEKELALLPYLASPSKVSIDIGANRGVYTHCLGKTSSKVHAFEPNPKMYRTLQRTAPANAQTYQVALSNSAGEAIFRIPKGVKGLSKQRGTLRMKPRMSPMSRSALKQSAWMITDSRTSASSRLMLRASSAR